MLEFDDIQHILLTRAPGAHGAIRIPFVSQPRGRTAWLAAILEKVQSAAAMQASVDKTSAG